MSRGIAYLYTKTSAQELFTYIVEGFRKIKIQLESPKTNKIQMWDDEGEMIEVGIEEIKTILPKINKYLIQFWWENMIDVSLKIYTNDSITEACLYLDGLDDEQLNDVCKMLISLVTENGVRKDILGFVIDRQERISEFDWEGFFVNNEIYTDFIEKTFGVSIQEKYLVSEESIIQLMKFNSNSICIGKQSSNRTNFEISVLS